MGGDHKCPVCQATFTRPQHVARHMRSHTGDRPYKCQHCGDQFARSDLLSRHINKCHPSEAGGTTGGGRGAGRRKATTHRATTSKQACDQCVQNSLPCDGAVPCGKCMVRKIRCTFVKFHRQTAPVGPGHTLQPPSPTPLTSGDPTHTPTMSMSLPGTGVPLSYPPPHGYSQRAGYAQQEFVPSHGHPSVDLFPHSHPQPSQGEWAGMNVDPHTHYQRMGPGGGDFDMFPPGHIHAGYKVEGKESRPSTASSTSSRSSHTTGSSSGLGSIDETPHTADFGFLGDVPGGIPAGVERGEGGFSSAFGLLSLEDENVLAGLSEGVPFFSTTSSSDRSVTREGDNSQFSFQPPEPPVGRGLHFSPLPQPHPSTLPPIQQAGGYHSGFTPYLQGWSDDGRRPQTSSAASGWARDPTATSLEDKTPSATREMETRELREFWKQYVRTPLSGPTPSAHTPAGLGMGAPSDGLTPMGYKRQRVNSLPSIKTPPLYGAPGGNGSYVGGGNSYPQLPAVYGGAPQKTTIHNADDLRSYEAAVLARARGVGMEMKLRPPPPAKGSAATKLSQGHSRPPSSASSTGSSLAGALSGHSAAPIHLTKPFYAGSPSASAYTAGSPSSASSSSPSAHGGSDEDQPYVPSSSLTSASSFGSNTSSSLSSTLGSTGRPNFKRLPSQTLGPEHSKRERLSGSISGVGEED